MQRQQILRLRTHCITRLEYYPVSEARNWITQQLPMAVPLPYALERFMIYHPNAIHLSYHSV